MKNQYEFRIFGLRRSGNHALISWIISNFGNNEVFYFNDVRNASISLYNTPSFISKTDRRVKAIKEKLAERRHMFKNKVCLIHSYEDRDLNIIKQVDHHNNGKSENLFNILILRDPYNMVASRLELEHPNTRVTPKIMSLWEQYAKEYMGLTNILDNKIVVDYNQFCSNPEYRNKLALSLKLDPEKVDNNIVLGFGRGSSFTGQNKESTNKYNERWEKYKNNPKFTKWVSSTEIRQYAKVIFGNIINEEDSSHS